MLAPELAQLMLDQTAHPFVVIDHEGTISYASESCVGVVGLTQAEVIGRNMLDFVAPDSIDRAMEGLHEVNELNVLAIGVPMVFELLHGDGHHIWCEVGAMTFPEVSGLDQIALRLRPWDAQHHFDRFIALLLASAPLDRVCEELGHSIAAELQCSGVVVHHGFDGHSFAAASGFGIPMECITADSGPWHRTATTGEPMVVSVDDLPEKSAVMARSHGIRTCWTSPVALADGLPPAVLSVWLIDDGPPLLGHRIVLGRSVTYVQLALVRWAEHERLVHLAGHDALTGVANRTLFRNRLAGALSAGEQNIAVAFCDLDEFKAINDGHGHQVGDKVLVAVAERLRGSLRTGDELARVGGDEFTLLLRNVPDGPTALRVADRLLASCAPPFTAGEEQVNVGISVGIALVRPGATADQLLELADTALYEAKRAGGRQAYVAG